MTILSEGKRRLQEIHSLGDPEKYRILEKRNEKKIVLRPNITTATFLTKLQHQQGKCLSKLSPHLSLWLPNQQLWNASVCTIKRHLFAFFFHSRKTVGTPILYIDSLRSKRFQSSYCAKVRARAKKGGRGRGRGEEETLARFLRSPPPPPPLHSFFCSRPNFLDKLARKRLLRRLVYWHFVKKEFYSFVVIANRYLTF